MRFLNKIILMALFLGFAHPVSTFAAEDTVLKNTQEAIQLAKQIIQIQANEIQFADTKTKIQFSLILDAIADEGFSGSEATSFDCFYGGWPSKLVKREGRFYCQNPKKIFEHQKAFQQSKCSSNELLCNPMLFGPGHCVDVSSSDLRRTTSARCEQAFQGEPLHGDYSFLKNVSSEDREKIFSAVKEICKTETKNPNRGSLCKRFNSKVSQIKEYFSAHKNGSSQTVKSKEEKQNKKIEATKNEQCPDCGVKATAPQPASKTVGDLVNALNDSPEVIYQKIKDRYFSSGQCHRYSFLPKTDQEAFKIKLYRTEIEAFRPNASNPSIPANEALSTLVKEGAISADESSRFQSMLPGLKGEEEKAEFQSKIIASLRARLDDPSLKGSIEKRVKELYQKNGIPNDCDPNDNDFVTKEAFVEAYQARNKVNGLEKPNLMTILDRSFSKNSRRLTTIDLGTGEVLYHSLAAFGDGDGNGATVKQEESPYCENKSGTNASPYGYGRVNETRTSGSFPGPGTFVSTGFGGSGLSSRGIAFHSLIGGTDAFTGYTPEEGYDRPGNLLDQAVSNPNTNSVNALLYKRIISAPEPKATNGCVGVPKEILEPLQKTIQNGSYVYFYCPREMRK